MLNNLKITDIKSELYEWDRPAIWNGSHVYSTGRLHKITIFTNEGIEGVGWNGGTAAERPLALMPGYVDYFKPLLVGRDPTDTKGIVRDLGESQIKILGPAGLNTQVLAAINIACWDIVGKALGKSVHQLLGGAQQRIRAYIAGGYYSQGKGLKELQEEMIFNVEVLHTTAVKMKIGSPDVGMKEDLKRVEAVRQAIGDDITLMVDANCALTVNKAIDFADELINYGVYWFEEPISIFDHDGHQKLSQSSEVKIATGENGYTLEYFKTLLNHNGAAILNVDATICAGYDIALEVAALADQNQVSIAPHGCQELQLPLAAAVSNGEFLEYYPSAVDPLRSEMFYPELVLEKDGYVTVPDRPGIGFDLNTELLSRYLCE